MNSAVLLAAFAEINDADVASARDNENIRREFRRAKRKKIELSVSAGLCAVVVAVTALAVRTAGIRKMSTAANGSVAEVAPADAGTTVPAFAGGETSPYNGAGFSPTETEYRTAVAPAADATAGAVETTVGYTQAVVSAGNKAAVPASVPSVQSAGVPETATAAPVTENQREYDGIGSGGAGWFNIPVIPGSGPVVESGDRITDAEAADYFRDDPSILYSLAASGVDTTNAVISARGYSHVSYTGAENEKPVVKLDFRDYLVHSNGRLISIITLYRVDGKIYSSPAFGAAWFDDYNHFLNIHKGQELLYVYAGQTELILTPDGSAYSTLGYKNVTDYTGGRTDLYSLFYHPDAVYVP